MPAGPLQDSAFTEGQWLVQRGERFVQVPELLYRVVELADGSRGLKEIADALTASTRWEVTAGDVAALIERKLAPLGLVEGVTALPPRSTPRSALLLNARLGVLGPHAIDRVARIAQHLYRPPVLIASLGLIALSQVWLFFGAEGPASAGRAVATVPTSILAIAGLIVLTGVVHEFGHAAALRYSGGRARSMGAGLYLVIPVFYTDVTESYRLNRAGRLRTDLGGFYFHLLAAAALVGLYALTGEETLLVTAFLIDVDIARQLIPFIRLDGYWVLSDLTGIPDLFSHAGPRLRRLLRRPHTGGVVPMRPAARRLFAAYLAVAIPAVLALFVYIAWHGPGIVRAVAIALGQRVDTLTTALDDAAPLLVLSALVEMLMLALPVAGLAALALVLARGLVSVLRSRAASRRGPVSGPLAWEAAVANGTLATLDPVTRAVLELSVRHQLSVEDIARAAGTDTNTVRRRHREALAALAGTTSSRPAAPRDEQPTHVAGGRASTSPTRAPT